MIRPGRYVAILLGVLLGVLIADAVPPVVARESAQAPRDVTKTDVVKTDIAKTDIAKTDVAKTDVAKTDTAKADLAKKADAAKTKDKPKDKTKSKAKDKDQENKENKEKITKLCHPRQSLKVLWKGQWRDAEVLKKPTRDGRCYIHFKGWDSKLDEWVTGNRIKSADTPPEPAAAKPAPAAAAGRGADKPAAEKAADKAANRASNATPIGSPAKCPEGKPAKVKWKEKWYEALIRKGPDKIGRCFIHYEGWDNSWDEWVTPDRIRLNG